MHDEVFLSRQICYMYGKYYDQVVNHGAIYQPKSKFDFSVHDCFNHDEAPNCREGTRDRIREFIQFLRRFWNKDRNEYTIACNWHDNVHYDKFILTYNRKHGTRNQVIFPLLNYSIPSSMRIDDHIDFRHKQNKLFWRGTSTGNDDINQNKRYQIISRNFHAHPEIDIGFSNLCQPVYENNRDRFHQLTKGNLDKQSQTQFKFILNIEGNDAASSFPWALASNCCPLHNYPFNFETYVFGMGLEPYVHFVPINSDGSDLVEKYHWCINNQDKCEEIARNGKIYMEKYLRDDLFDQVMRRFFNLYPRIVS